MMLAEHAPGAHGPGAERDSAVAPPWMAAKQAAQRSAQQGGSDIAGVCDSRRVGQANEGAQAQPALLQQALSTDVLEVLKRNADQLLELKKQHIAERQATQEAAKRMGAWSAGSIGVSGDGASPFRSAAAQADLAVDAVRHGRLKFFTLPGSGIVAPPRTAAPASSGRKFWQLGVQSAGLPRRPGSVTPSSQGGEAALQPHKSLASLLFGRSRRGSYAGGGGSSTPASPGSARWAAQLDPAASWRSSFDGGSSGAHALSRRGSARRSSDSSVLRSSLAHLPQAAAAAAGAAARQDGGVWASLASGEGPLSKSHALLAKPGPGTDAVGRSLECVAEDEREGRDSPVPGASASGGGAEPAGLLSIMQSAPPPIRVPTSAAAAGGGSGAAASPVQSSISFSRHGDKQAHSPAGMLRASISSSRLPDPRASLVASSQQLGGAAAGPLLRSSVSLARGAMAPRVDPFEAAEPEEHGVAFAEQMRQEDRAMRVARESAANATAAELMGALRRSISGAGRGVSGGGLVGAPRWELQPGGLGPLASGSLAAAHMSGSAAGAGTAQEEQLRECAAQQQSGRDGGADEVCAASPEDGMPAAAAAESRAVAADEDGRRSPAPAPLSGGRSQLLASPAPGMASPVPPLLCASPSRRQLPTMGQASMDILSRPRPLAGAGGGAAGMQPGCRGLPGVASSSSSMKLTEVYQQTGGNLTPLAAGLNSLRRSSSQGGRPAPAPGGLGAPPRNTARRVSASLLAEPPMPGPLSQQHSATMLHAKRSAAGLSGGGGEQALERKGPGWAWQVLGLPTGPGAPLADPTIDPATCTTSNKYAASWGLVDMAAASTATATPSGGVSRQPSGHLALSRQNSAGSLRGSPRHPAAGMDAQQPLSARHWHQQQQQQQMAGGAAGRYTSASATPTELSRSPRSFTGRATPRQGSELGGGAMQHGFGADSSGGGVWTAQASARAASEAGSDYASAAETLSTASGSSYSHGGMQGSSRRTTGSGAGAWQLQRQQLQAGSRGGSGLSAGGQAMPTPPAFLQQQAPAPTSAQAAVAAAWSPNKQAVSAVAQAPAGLYALASPEASMVAYSDGGAAGLVPRGLPGSFGASPRHSDAAAAAAGFSAPATARTASDASGGGSVRGGYARQPYGAVSYAPQAAGRQRVAPHQQQQVGQPQPVITAVDLARERVPRRTSSSSHSSAAAAAQHQFSSGGGGGACGGGQHVVPVSAAAAGKLYGQHHQQQQWAEPEWQQQQQMHQHQQWPQQPAGRWGGSGSAAYPPAARQY